MWENLCRRRYYSFPPICFWQRIIDLASIRKLLFPFSLKLRPNNARGGCLKAKQLRSKLSSALFILNFLFYFLSPMSETRVSWNCCWHQECGWPAVNNFIKFYSLPSGQPSKKKKSNSYVQYILMTVASGRKRKKKCKIKIFCIAQWVAFIFRCLCFFPLRNVRNESRSIVAVSERWNKSNEARWFMPYIQNIYEPICSLFCVNKFLSLKWTFSRKK